MTTIKLKNGSGAPATSDLVQGEPALDLTNKRLYTEDSGGSVIEVGTNPTSLTTGTFTSTGIDDNATSTAITIDASENVGIGSASPAAPLHVETSGNTGIQIRSGTTTSYGNINFNDGATAKGQILYNHDGDYMRLYVNGAEAMRIDSSSNVGIGTTSPTFGSGSGLEIEQSGTATVRVERTGATASAGEFFAGNDKVAIGSTSNTHLELRTNSTERMRIDSSGNVGIGTTSPTSGAGWDLFINMGGTDSNALILDGTESQQAAVGAVDGLYLDCVGSSTASKNRIIFRTQSANSNYTGVEAMRIDSSGQVGIGTASPTRDLQIGTSGSGSNATLSLQTSTTGTASIYMGDGTGSGEYAGLIRYSHSDNYMSLWTNSTERMRIDSSGNLLFGTTNTLTSSELSAGETGIVLREADLMIISRDGGAGFLINRKTSDGDLIEFRKDGTTVGSIASVGGTGLRINSEGSDGYLQKAGSDKFGWTDNDFSPANDNLRDLGQASLRYDDVYATNATIQTSDVNEKQDIEVLSEAETRVAVAAKGLLRKFRWKSAVEEKGDDARIHFGIIAQDLQAAFEAEGLDAGDYGMFIHSTWTDEETGEERSRMGVRYSELLAFIIAAI